jgi:hypothetical protein
MRHWLAVVVLLGWAAAAGAQEKEKEALPTARAVIGRYIEAAGGKEAFLKKKSVLIKGKAEVTGKDLSGTMTLATAHPNKMLLVVNMAGMTVRTGFDGKVGWQMNPLTGPALVEEKALRDMEREADFHAILHDDKGFKSMENLGKVQFEGEECYKLKLVYTGGSEVLEYYSVKTGLQVGFTGTQESSFGPITATSVNNEHKQFGDLFLPSKVTQKMSGLSQSMIVDSMEFDVVDAATFELPPEVKALVAATKEQEPAKLGDEKSDEKKSEEKTEKAPAAPKGEAAPVAPVVPAAPKA